MEGSKLANIGVHTDAAGLSDKGLVRDKNEDVWESLADEHFYILADGMGGHQAGEIAAYKTVDTICEMVKAYSFSIDVEKQTQEEVTSLLTEAIQQANSLIYQMGQSNDRFTGMGTTVCCLCIRTGFIICAHVGDSRIYRLRDGELNALTLDHSLVMDLIESGQMTAEEAKNFKRKNVITRAIGIDSTVKSTLSVDNIRSGDIYLLCSDGLSDYVSAEVIKENLVKDDNLNEVCQLLIDEAKNSGSKDNITVVAVRVQD